ncbi:hypothetical protein Tco_0812675 [Tanacetum coccineum]
MVRYDERREKVEVALRWMVSENIVASGKIIGEIGGNEEIRVQSEKEDNIGDNGEKNHDETMDGIENDANGNLHEMTNELVCVVSVLDNVTSNLNVEICTDKLLEKSYVSALSKDLNDNNELFLVPRIERSWLRRVVKNGSIFYTPLKVKYNLRRMWGRHGLKDIVVVDADEMCYFKLNSDEGMNYVIDRIPWLVNEKPLISAKGISTISSSLGRPIMMDQMTSDICKIRAGRLGYARILIEVEAVKGF